MRWFIFSLALVAILGIGLAEPRRGSGRTPKGSAAKRVLEETAEEEENDGSPKRDGKLFSLFNVVQFANNGCRTTSTISSSGSGSGVRNGTCFTATECKTKGGTSSGNCAAGFGVCCLFLVSTSGTTISQNCTYVRNPGFPTAYSGGTTGVSYTVAKSASTVCSLRLDFESFTIRGTGNTVETDTAATPITTGGVCLDSFTITTNTKQTIPTICGQNTGQHLYVDIGNAASDTATLNFAFSGAASTRLWEIKVSQIPCRGQCSKSYQAPPGCLQYQTGLTGRLTTFNFIPTTDNHLANQDYSICIRQEKGYCCIQYMACTDVNSFSLDTHGVATTIPADANAKSMIDTACSGDYVGISASNGACNKGCNKTPVVNKYCGLVFNASPMATVNAVVCDCTTPFVVDIFTDSQTDTLDGKANIGQSRGACLTWTQVPCSS